MHKGHRISTIKRQQCRREIHINGMLEPKIEDASLHYQDLPLEGQNTDRAHSGKSWVSVGN